MINIKYISKIQYIYIICTINKYNKIFTLIHYVGFITNKYKKTTYF